MFNLLIRRGITPLGTASKVSLKATKLGCNRVFSRSNQRTANTMIASESTLAKNAGWLGKISYHFEFTEYNKYALMRSSIYHYEACTDQLDIESYFKNFQLPDTTFSFYLVVQLHVWMCQVRSMQEGKDGRLLRNEIMERMWQDFDMRLSEIDIYSSGRRRNILDDLLLHHQAAMLSYDEGLLVDDKTLANALWRTLFSKEDVDPRVLELAVEYVRTQIDHVKSLSARDWCIVGRFGWAPCESFVTKPPTDMRVKPIKPPTSVV